MLTWKRQRRSSTPTYVIFHLVFWRALQQGPLVRDEMPKVQEINQRVAKYK
jgi:hypothetical protein